MSMTIGKEAREELHRIATFSDDSQARQLLRSFLECCADADEGAAEFVDRVMSEIFVSVECRAAEKVHSILSAELENRG